MLCVFAREYFSAQDTHPSLGGSYENFRGAGWFFSVFVSPRLLTSLHQMFDTLSALCYS